ncbi:MAG TPA: hypothetical protein VI815_04095 [Candidatus Nanoarchaeia archaeon]|nr:hypothetical protein [Candidatus Nanoarchaeia archaeon]
MQEHKHLVELLKEAKKAAKSYDVFKLKQLSNETVHSATIYRDTDNVVVAILVYALGKLIERKDSFQEKDFNKYFTFYLSAIEDLIGYIDDDNEKMFKNKINNLFEVKGLSEDLKKSVLDVFRKARINKASKIYEHGISMESTAKLLGISIWELAEYSGQTNISEMNMNKTVDVRKRIKNAMEFFS